MRRSVKLIVTAALLAVGVGSWFVCSSLQTVPVDSLFADPEGKGLDIRVIENGRVARSVHVNQDSAWLTDVRHVIEQGSPKWRWWGFRPDVSTSSFRIDIVSSVRATHIEPSGMMQVQDRDGRDRRAHTPRSSRIYDQIAEAVRTAAGAATDDATQR